MTRDDAIRPADYYLVSFPRCGREPGTEELALLPVRRGDFDTYQTRKGRVGGYLEELSPEDIHRFENAMRASKGRSLRISRAANNLLVASSLTPSASSGGLVVLKR